MPTPTIRHRTEAGRLAYGRAIAFAAEPQQLGRDGPPDRVLDACEAAAPGRGRDLPRGSPAAAARGRIDRAEQKGATRRGWDAARPAAIGGDGGDGGDRS